VRRLRQLLGSLLASVLGAGAVLVAGFVWVLEQREDLEIWHEVELDAEFSADVGLTNFEEYVALEERLFAQLEERVYARVPVTLQNPINRFSRDSLSDPSRWPTNWNQTFELATEDPELGILLLHGMSDSPYSVRSLGQRLHSQGAHVIGLRLPGHGTAPAGLLHVEWEDMSAAVALAVQHLRSTIADRPLLLVGYSNGGALAVQHVLSSLGDENGLEVQGVVLLSPEIGITPLAALAEWQEGLGGLIGLRKLSWQSILPEYDPYKYNSFALNAGKQAYHLTEQIQRELDRLAPTGALNRFPPLLAFQSAVDATVSAPALVNGLFRRLPDARSSSHELIIFDVNRSAEVEAVLKNDPGPAIQGLLTDPERSFTVTLVTNADEQGGDIVARRHAPRSARAMSTPLGLRWPNGIYSLSHVSLPFRPDDPLYGGAEARSSPGIQLGNVSLRGERGALQISADDLMRLRWNPFYEYLERRIEDFAAR